MMQSLRYRLAVGAILALTIIALVPLVASAHERRPVGPYTFVVGFLNEPALQGQPNGLDLTITDASGSPVEGAEKTLKVAVSYGGGPTRELSLRARWGQKGKYTADLIPTKAGSYAFTFTGTLNGQPVNARFESGPGRFDDVMSPQELEFPEVVPAPADLAQETRQANATAQLALQRATLFGLAGIALGLVGVIVGGVALLTRSRVPIEPEAGPRLAEEQPGRGAS